MSNLALRSIARQVRDLNIQKVGFTSFYIDGTNGSDSYTGESWNQAFKTIQHAVDTGESWAKIFIKAGTYAENVSISNQGIHLIGEKINTVIIQPSTGAGIHATHTGQGCVAETLTAVGNGTGSSNAGIVFSDHYCIAKNVIVGNQNASGHGISSTGNYPICDGISIDQSNRPNDGIRFEGYYGELKNCILENVGRDGIVLREMACYWNKVHDNIIIDAGRYGIHLYGMGTDKNTIFHNNIIGSATANLHDTTTNVDNKFFENFYYDHSNIDNGFGIAKAPYAFTGGTDPRPVVCRNGWLGLSWADADQVGDIKLKTDLLNSAAGTSTLRDANPSDTIVPGSLPTKMHVIFDISGIIVAADDFILEVKVGVSGSERVVAYYKITSDGTDTTIDTGSGTGAVVKQRRIDISNIMVYTGERVLLNYTKNSAIDRYVLYRYVCGV